VSASLREWKGSSFIIIICLCPKRRQSSYCSNTWKPCDLLKKNIVNSQRKDSL
jgi:hypothetical protein